MSSIRTCNEQVASLSFDAYGVFLPRYSLPPPPLSSSPAAEKFDEEEKRKEAKVALIALIRAPRHFDNTFVTRNVSSFL